MTQLDRIEERLQAVDDRTRLIEIRIAKNEGRAGVIRYVVTATIGAVAGLFSGSLHLPWGH